MKGTVSFKPFLRTPRSSRGTPGDGPEVATCVIADAEVTLLTQDQLTAAVVRLATQDRVTVVANHNLHSLYLLHTLGEDFEEFYRQADLVHIDGMGIVALGRCYGQAARREHRTTYVDWIQPLIQEAFDRGLKILFLGGSDGTAARAVKHLERRLGHPLSIDCIPGYFDLSVESALQDVEQAIRASTPSIVLVGMGMPRQELWIHARRSHLPPAVYLTAGGLFDYLAGNTRTPPRLIGQLGLEWLFRLVSNPVSLWRRYLVEPIALLSILTKRHFRTTWRPSDG